MGFRFRKSFGKGPFRVTVSKSGVGYSVGGKGFRYTKKAGGGTRTTASIPGTGISYVKDSGSGKTRSTSSGSAAQNVSNPDTASLNQGYCVHCYRILEPGTIQCPACGKSQLEKPSPEKYELTGMHVAAIAILIIVIMFWLCGCGKTPETTMPTVDMSILEELEKDNETTEATEAPSVATADLTSIFGGQRTADQTEASTYILNSNTNVFHKPGCSDAEKISNSHKSSYTGDHDDIIAKGYHPCKNCNP